MSQVIIRRPFSELDLGDHSVLGQTTDDVKFNFVLAIPLICLPRHLTFGRIANPIPHAWQNPVEHWSFQTPLRYKIRTRLLGIIFAEKGIRPYFQERSKVKSGEILMRSFIDGNGGSTSNRLIQEKLDATVSPNATDTRAPQ